MNIKGYIKTSLVDYPGLIATTAFTSGCNMRCPFCHNKELVIDPSNEFIPIEEFLAFIKKRQPVLEGICITGGEPTLQKDLPELLSQLKAYNLKIKLDTNGLNPNVLETLLYRNLLDYVAMDIKNSLSKYAITAGISADLLPNILKSVEILQSSKIDYEFRTTVIKEFHDINDFKEVGMWLKGSKKYYLQQYKYSENQISSKIYTAYHQDELEDFKQVLLPYFDLVALRNV